MHSKGQPLQIVTEQNDSMQSHFALRKLPGHENPPSAFQGALPAPMYASLPPRWSLLGSSAQLEEEELEGPALENTERALPTEAWPEVRVRGPGRLCGIFGHFSM